MRKFVWCSSVVALMAGAVLAEDVGVTETVVDSAGVEVTTIEVDAIESVGTEGEFSDVEYTTLEVDALDSVGTEGEFSDADYTTLEVDALDSVGTEGEFSAVDDTTLEFYPLESGSTEGEFADVDVTTLEFYPLESGSTEGEFSAVDDTTLEVTSDPTLVDIAVQFDEFVKPDEECLHEGDCQHYEILSFSGVPVEGDVEIRTLSPELAGEQALMMMSAGMVQRNNAVDNAVDTAAVPSLALDQLSAEQRTGARQLTNVPSKGRFNPLARLFGRKAAPAADQPGTILQTSAIQMTPAQRDRAQQLAAIDRIRDRAIATGDQGLLKKADRMAAELRTK